MKVNLNYFFEKKKKSNKKKNRHISDDLKRREMDVTVLKALAFPGGIKMSQWRLFLMLIMFHESPILCVCG